MRLKSTFYLLLVTVIVLACADGETAEQPLEVIPSPDQIKVASIDSMLSAEKLDGAVLIFDPVAVKYYSNDFVYAQEDCLPASTFKIPNSIIALETGVMADENQVIKWDGKKRRFKSWEKDLRFEEAFKVSCLPCYQTIADSIGFERMNKQLDVLQYPGMEFDADGLNSFWVLGKSALNQFDQVAFLSRLFYSELGISERTESLLKRFMLLDNEENYQLFGKTGWAQVDDENIGWFVGYLERANRTYFFATRLVPKKDFDMDGFLPIRKEVTLKALDLLDFL